MRYSSFGNLLLILLVISAPAHARGIYQQPEDFIKQTFANNPPAPKIVWLTSDIRPAIEKILAHKATRLRIRYWLKEGRSAWILDEIGKHKPITAGFIVNKGKLESVKILVFRESRGWEISKPFFTRQFKSATLTADLELDRNIDGISGATLSVRAIRKLSRIALLLAKKIIK